MAGGFRRFELIDLHHDRHFSPFSLTETSIFPPKTLPFSISPFVHDLDDDLNFSSSLDLLRSTSLLALARVPSPFEIFDSVTDLIQIGHTPPPFFSSSFRTLVEHRLGSVSESIHLRSLCDRVSALEQRFDRLVSASAGRDRKYTWTAEIKSPAKKKDGLARTYKWTEEIKGGKKNQKNYKWATEIKGGKKGTTQKKVVEVEEEDGLVKNYKWTAEIKGKDDGDDSEVEAEVPIQQIYSFKASSVDGSKKKEEKEDKEKKKECKKKEERGTRLVEIEDPTTYHGVVALRQAFARRAGADIKCKGKKKELSPQDAALMIQVTFKAYLIRRSQALRALRELAVAKGKLKEIRALFHNFSYRNRIACDREEHQRFSEKIIILLLTVDAIEGADLMVRSSKRCMVDELEAMLDVVDPQPPGKSLSMKRRTFDMPNGAIQKEIAAGVAKLVQIVDQHENGSSAFEACL